MVKKTRLHKALILKTHHSSTKNGVIISVRYIDSKSLIRKEEFSKRQSDGWLLHSNRTLQLLAKKVILLVRERGFTADGFDKMSDVFSLLQCRRTHQLFAWAGT